MNKKKIDDVDIKRFQFLYRLYVLVKGNVLDCVDIFKIGEDIGFEKGASVEIAKYLKGKGLISWMGGGYSIEITEDGVQEVESAKDHPQETTNYFPAGIINFINIKEKRE